MHDYLLVALAIGAGYFFLRYLSDVEAKGEGRPADLLIGAVLLGLAGLTKYSAVFVAIGIAGAILVRPRLRPLLMRWELYAAALLTLLLQAPTLIWNAQNDFASIAYQLSGRYGSARFAGLDVGRMKTAIVESVALVSPILLVPATLLFFWARQPTLFERVGKTVAICVFWLSALTFLYIANYGLVLFWWVAITFALVLPFAGRYVGPIALALHTLWGGIISIFMVVSFTLGPLTGPGGLLSMETDYMYGWDRVAAAVRAAQTENGATMLATNRYQHAAQLAFVLDDPDVIALSRREDGFDDWSDLPARTGEDAIVLVLRRDDTQTWKRYFAEVRQLGEISLEQRGTHLTTYTLWLGTDFRPLDGDEAPP
jgi:hypothetical protein